METVTPKSPLCSGCGPTSLFSPVSLTSISVLWTSSVTQQTQECLCQGHFCMDDMSPSVLSSNHGPRRACRISLWIACQYLSTVVCFSHYQLVNWAVFISPKISPFCCLRYSFYLSKKCRTPQSFPKRKYSTRQIMGVLNFIHVQVLPMPKPCPVWVVKCIYMCVREEQSVAAGSCAVSSAEIEQISS